MKELSLNVLDITENSVKAGSKLTSIFIMEDEERITIRISDNGCGMSEETLKSVENPFYTTRTTRSVGLGIPLLKLAAEQTGGHIELISKTESEFPDSHGTTISAHFFKNHIDFTPLGNIISTIQTLIQGHPDVDFRFIHEKNGGRVEIDTREMRQVLDDVPLNSYEVIAWIGESLKEQYADI